MEIMPGTPGANPMLSEAAVAPLPVLGQSYGDLGSHSWQEAPSGVRSAFHLAILGSIIFGLAFLLMVVVLTMGANSSQKQEISGLFVPAAFYYGVLFPLNILLAWGHRKALPIFWSAQFVLSILGTICCFPIGTILHILLLLRWSRPETKAWYGLD